jgi:hypothetical protein
MVSHAINLADPRQATPVVIRDAISNIFFVLISACVVFGLSKLSWWAGVVPFWILAAICGVCILQYLLSAVLQVVLLAGSLWEGFRTGWESFRLQLIKSLGTSFKILEAAVDAAVIFYLWTYFYR